LPPSREADILSTPNAGPGAPSPGFPRLVVGLGNPGPEYQGTRHNVGFLALDRLATRLDLQPSAFKAGGQRIGDLYRDPDRRFGLLWPATFMNLSGGAVAAGLRRLETTPASIFVILDDFHLPLGALRLRPMGSPGGHKGLKSIVASLGTNAFPRLRVGVGSPGLDPVGFVLSRFRRSESKIVEETLETASWAAEDWIRGVSLEELQTRYNRRKP